MHKRNAELTKSKIIDVASKLFIEKGYDNTYIQDIINDLDGLTKGAIYHHFNSKEDILDAVINRIGEKNIKVLSSIRDTDELTGVEKLKKIIIAGINSDYTKQIMGIAPGFVDNPRFLAALFKQMHDVSVPEYIVPIINEGIKDGTIKAVDANVLAELIVLLINVWLNPLIFSSNQILLKHQIINVILSKFDIKIFDT